MLYPTNLEHNSKITAKILNKNGFQSVSEHIQRLSFFYVQG